MEKKVDFINHEEPMYVKLISDDTGSVSVKVINRSKYELPKYETEGAAGMDIKANIDNPITLKPLERKLISTGLYIKLPTGYEAQIRPRSGMALKYGITVLNTPGTVK